MRLTSPRWARQLVVPEIVQRLDGVYSSNTGGSLDKRRGHVIEPALCKDVLDRIRPSLPAPSTCDIIDINPGPAVWSQALHNVLQPRRHVLVEEEIQNYAQFLDPLLASSPSSSSSYRLLTDARDAFDPHQDYLSPELRAKVVEKDGSLLLLDNTHQNELTKELIITANFTGRNMVTDTYKGSRAKFSLHAFYYSLFGRGRRPYQRYGLVRLLAWIPEHDKQNLIPRGVLARSRQSTIFETYFDVEELVSGHPYRGIRSQSNKWYSADVHNRQNVARLQRELGEEIPPGRDLPFQQPPSIYYEPIPDNFDTLLSLEDRPRRIDEYINMYRRMEEECPEWLRESYADARGRPRGGQVDPSHEALAKTDPRRLFLLARTRMGQYHRNYKEVEHYVDRQMQLERELVDDRRAHPNDDRRYDDHLAQLRPRLEEIKTIVSMLFVDSRNAFRKAVDDYRAEMHGALVWNARRRDPLFSHSSEFYPKNRLALVSITPRTSVMQRLDTFEKSVSLDYIIFTMTAANSEVVHNWLARLLGSEEAVLEFAERCPALLDPGRGGWYDLKELRCRTLPRDLIMDITLAWEGSRFKEEVPEMLRVLTARVKWSASAKH